MKTLRKCEWEDINPGEVFAWRDKMNMIWFIDIKLSDDPPIAKVLAVDKKVGEEWVGLEDDDVLEYYWYSLYKLPLSIQRNWIEWDNMPGNKQYKILIRNFVKKRWEILKLKYDPRTDKEGLAIYDNKEDAEFYKDLVESIYGGMIQTKIKSAERRHSG